ncbi:MAG: hypothetical protein L6R38_000090 [Xanthoria sp. 2 TBL-2021]|nr:MAG: hypothetical protein L6R38_000090 [Xanthoria sp. 2 TBL-2021]
MASQRPASRQQNTQLPISSPGGSTASPQAGRSSPSHSAYSEDSQTVILNTPSSEETPSGSKNKQTKTGESLQAPPADEPRRCWICFSDEAEDSPTSSEWRSPCPCVLTAHESCLLDWVADRENPQKNGSARPQTIECPQCKAEIRIARPHSQVVQAYRTIQNIAGRLFWPGIIGSLVSGMGAACVLHGASTVYLLLGTYDAEILLGVRNGRMPSSNCLLGLASIPGVLMLSSTSFADPLLPVLPIFFIAGHRPTRQAGRLWPPSAAMTLATLPYMRAVYNGLRRKVFQEREKKWVRQLQPRAGEDENNAENGLQEQQRAENDQPAENGEAGGLNFEIGVELEIIDEEEVPVEDEQRQEVVNEEVVPNQAGQVRDPGQNHNEGPNAAPDGQANQDRNNNPNQNPAQPAAPAINPAPLAEQHRVIRLVPLVSAFVHTMIGALAFPAVAAGMGGLISLFLPWTWRTPPGRWDYRSPGLLQSRFGRSVVGGCLFLVLKDTLSLYTKYRLAEDHLHRKVLDYDRRGHRTRAGQ